uniref:Class II fructose-bisphosphate aldolase n=2 Tax=Ignisphaera aggregans TaxID=334771 RepID=A0A7J3I828_9CREN
MDIFNHNTFAFKEAKSAKSLLDAACKVLKRNITLLCISPISRETVVATLRAAKSINAPIIFAASLNQIDINGGYTGWTPKRFVEFVHQEAEAINFNGIVFFEVDHCGPWLKDEHIISHYDYQTALENVIRSIEGFIDAGFRILHIDTSLDRESPAGFANIDTAAKRTVELISFAEDVAKSRGIDIMEYEIGSDRWNMDKVEDFRKFLSLAVGMLKSRKIDVSKITFAVADVGTRVRPGNIMNTPLALKFVDTLKDYSIYLKIHSGDYLENLDELPRNGIGGINIGPMFAHIQYTTIKEVITSSGRESLLKIFKENIERNIISSDKLGRYFANSGEIEEYKVGLASRYIWSNNSIRDTVNLISREIGIDLFRKCIESIEYTVRRYLIQLNLENLVNIFKEFNTIYRS